MQVFYRGFLGLLALLLLNAVSATAQLKIPHSQIALLNNLPEAQGKPVNIGPEVKGLVLIFTCNHCPFAKLYTSRINNLVQQYNARGIRVLAINPMDTLLYEDETFTYLQEKAVAESFQFAYLQDAAQVWGKKLKAVSTPAAFVLWKAGTSWVVKYAGSIDDNGEEPGKAKPYIALALNNLLAGKAVQIPKTTTFGCAITYRK